MKNLIFISVMLFCITFSTEMYAQSFSVPSPSAAQMTRYGGVSANEHSGRITTSIPLYNYQAGNLSLPIGLSYIGNGVRVDQQSSWVGTNWNLMSGGVVTRTVNHIADETANNRLFYEDIAFLSDEVNEDYTFDLLNGVNLEDDLRPDTFSFSFPGYSGSFYLDKTGQPRLMTLNSELKIEFANSLIDPTIQNTIIITTPSGVKYFFGGDHASESTSAVLNRIRGFNIVGDMDTADPTSIIEPIPFELAPKAITAYYMFKVEHPFGDTILLDYHDDGDQELTLFRGNELIAYEGLSYSVLNNLEQPIKGCGGVTFEQLLTEKLKDIKYIGKIYNKKKISRIYSPNSDFEIRFNSEALLLNPFTDDDAPQYDDRILRSIEVHNNLLNENVKNIKLNYLLTPYRFFLEEVITNNDSDSNSENKCSSYKLEYDQPILLPKRFSNAQDLLGYFNNQTSNLNLLPQVDNIEFEGVFSDLADRSNNFEFAKKGSLSKIVYPSGGYTQFDYESPKVEAITNQDLELITYANQPFANPNQLIASGFLGDRPGIGNPTVRGLSQDQTAIVSLNSIIDDTSSATTNYYNRATVEFRNVMTNQTVTKVWEFGSIIDNEEATGLINSSYQMYFDVEQGNSYNVTVTLSSNFTSSLDKPVTLKATVNFTSYEEFDAYGIRVSRITEIAEEGATPIIKKYYYKRAVTVYQDAEDSQSAVVTYDPESVKKSTFKAPCCSTSLGDGIFSYLSLRSNPFAYYFASSDNQVSYKYVTVSYGGDNFQEGGVQKTFRVERTEEPTLEFISSLAPPETSLGLYGYDNYVDNIYLGNLAGNNTILNGLPLQTVDLRRDNTLNGSFLFKKVREMNYSYESNPLYQTEGIILAPFIKNCPSNLISVTPSIGYYKNSTYDLDLKRIQTKDYTDFPIFGLEFETIEIGDYVESTREFEYGELQGMPTKITSLNTDGEYQITKNFYLTQNDINDMSGLTIAEENAYQELINQHRIGTAIQSESYFRKETTQEELRARQRVLYNDFNGLILQERNQTSRLNSPLETRTTYNKYDDKGYVLEMESDNNVVSSIIYGYKDKKVIAQIVNVNYDNIPLATIDNLTTLSNAVVDNTSMNALEAALDQLRQDFPQSQMTTYVYNRLGKLSSMKDARGYKMSYEYDDCYRLKQVKDHLGNILEEHEYNIINNNN